jgi:hypothetical protein
MWKILLFGNNKGKIMTASAADIVSRVDTEILRNEMLKTTSIHLSPLQSHRLLARRDEIPWDDTVDAMTAFLQDRVPWTLRQWIQNFRPEAILYRWEPDVEIPRAFTNHLSSLGFRLRVEPSAPTSDNKEEVRQRFSDLVLTLGSPEKKETWILFYHGHNRAYFEEMLDFWFLRRDYDSWKTTGNVTFALRLEEKVLPDFRQALAETRLFLFAFLTEWSHGRNHHPITRSISVRTGMPLHFHVFLSPNAAAVKQQKRYFASMNMDVAFYPSTEGEQKRIHAEVMRTLAKTLVWDYTAYYNVLYRLFIQHCADAKTPFFAVIHPDVILAKGFKKKLDHMWERYRGEDWDILVLHRDASDEEWGAAVINHTAYGILSTHFLEALKYTTPGFFRDLGTAMRVVYASTGIFSTTTTTTTSSSSFTDPPFRRYRMAMHVDRGRSEDQAATTTAADFHPLPPPPPGPAAAAPPLITERTVDPLPMPIEVPARVFLVGCSASTEQSWRTKHPTRSLEVVGNGDLHRYKFTEFEVWEARAKFTEKSMNLLPYLLLYHFGGTVVCWSDSLCCFQNDRESQRVGTTFVFTRKVDNIRILLGQPREPIVRRFLDFIFHKIGQGNDIDRIFSTRYLTHALLSLLETTTTDKDRDILNTSTSSYAVRIAGGKEVNKNNKVVKTLRFPYVFPRRLEAIKHLDIGIMVQSNEEYLEDFFWNAMTRVRKALPDIHFRLFFYENDSVDGTVASILRHKEEFDIILFRQNLGRFTTIDRITRLGKIRNFFIKNVVQHYMERGDLEERPYIMLLDTDVVFDAQTIVRLITDLAANPDAVMMGANIMARDDVYYDFLALDFGHYYDLKDRKGFRKTIEDNAATAATGTAPNLFPVKSIFGGITLLYRELLFFVKYGEREEDLQGTNRTTRCEHYKFCRDLARWGNVYIAKNAKGYWVQNWKTEKIFLQQKNIL